MTNDIIDRIDVRYKVELQFTLGDGKELTIARAELSITCGTYDGIPTKETLAALITSRGVTEDDIRAVGYLNAGQAAAKIAERKIEAKNIIQMQIQDVLLDESPIAQSLV